MKNRFLLFFIFLAYTSIAQITIRGTVYQDDKPLDGAAVYFNNTMLGTTTNNEGEFAIPVKHGVYELIISFLGFQKINYSLNTSTYNKPLVFKLIEEESILNEIVIKKTVYDDDWKYNLSVFKKEFIGISKLSEDCKILNPEVLYFEYDNAKGILTAYARKPLKMKHKSLGFLITYELESFVRGKNYITYLGYSRYQEMKGNKRKKRRWAKNRLKAYNGSVVHFYKSLIDDTFKKDGFIVNQFRRVPNSKRPSEEEIRNARQLVRMSGGGLNFSKKIINPKTALDSAMITLKKVRLPKSIDYLYKSKLKKKEIITLKDSVYALSFDNNISIVYKKEREEMAYITRHTFGKPRTPLAQTSSIIPVQKNIVLDKTGVLINPLAVFYEGYWSYEKFGNTLPLDYEPEK
jgi:hypothetical protein